ncbi:restriction endonuclease subunit S [Aeromonas veronii]
MSHYKPYPAYRDSGVEWIGQVPEHWESKRLRHIASFTNSNVDKKSYDGQEAVSLCNYTDVYYNDFITADMPFMQATASATEIKQFSLKKGDVIITKDSEDPSDIGIPSLVAEDVPGVICGYHLTMIRTACADTSRLLHRVLQSHPTQAHFFVEAPGITRYGLGQDAIGDVRVCLPPRQDRGFVADSIDRETARIDALIAKKTRFIELLKEKRQALITHAVTKGLDPNVKMRDSGVEWLGDIPEHWDFVPSNSLFPESKERAWAEDEHLSATQKYGVIPLAEYERLEERQVTHAVKNLDQRKHAEVGDFVISMRSFEGGIERVKARGCVRSSYVVLKASANAHIGFFTYLFKSGAYIQGLQATATFIRDGQDLSYNNFRQVKLPCPSLDEQKEIADFLDKSVSRIDGLTEKTQHSIDLLKERRAAFITAAVTGQIDLRESA